MMRHTAAVTTCLCIDQRAELYRDIMLAPIRLLSSGQREPLNTSSMLRVAWCEAQCNTREESNPSVTHRWFRTVRGVSIAAVATGCLQLTRQVGVGSVQNTMWAVGARHLETGLEMVRGALNAIWVAPYTSVPCRVLNPKPLTAPASQKCCLGLSKAVGFRV